MSLQDLWKSVYGGGQESLETFLGHFLCEFLAAASSHVAIPKIPTLCNTLGYQFIKRVHLLCNETDSNDYDSILSYLLQKEGWKIISCMLWTKLEGLTCVAELCNVVTSLFPICLSHLNGSHGIVNPYIPPSSLSTIESCFQSPKKIRKKERRLRIRKAREKERDESSDSESEVEKRPCLRIRFDRRDFEYFNRNMKSEDSLSDSDEETIGNHGLHFSEKAHSILNEEISMYELCSLLVETCIIAVQNEKMKKSRKYNLAALCLKFSASQLLSWDFSDASEGSYDIHMKLLKLFFTSSDLLCHSSEIFEFLNNNGVLQKLMKLTSDVTNQFEELNFNELILDTPAVAEQPVILEKMKSFSSDFVCGLVFLLSRIIDAKYSGGNVRKFVDLVHDVFSKNVEKTVEILLRSEYRERSLEGFEKLIKNVTSFVKVLKGYRDVVVHNQQCPKSVHKNCPIAVSHHHDIFGQQIRALKLGNSNSCLISWCLTALFTVFDECDEKWGMRILSAIKNCGLCCCLDTKSIFDNVMRKIRASKPEGYGSFRFLLFLYRQTGLCDNCNELCMLCKMNGGLMPSVSDESDENDISSEDKYSYFQAYYDVIISADETLLFATLDHLKQFSQSATQAVKQGLILKVVLPSLAHFKKIYLSTGQCEKVLEILLRILAISLNYEIVQKHGIDLDIFKQISDLLLKPQFSSSCARILHLATLLEVKNVDFESSAKPYTELLLGISDFHFSKLMEIIDTEENSVFYYELSDDRLKMGSEDVGYNSDYEKPEIKAKVRFGTIIEEDSAAESAIVPSDREFSERESVPEPEDMEPTTLPSLYVNVSTSHLTADDHLRVAAAVWEALVLSMLYSQRLLDVVRIRPTMKKVLRLMGPLLSYVLRNEEAEDYGMFESFIVSIQICGPFHVFPATSENPDDVTRVLIQCLAATSEIPVRFTSFLVNSLLSAAVLRKFLPNARQLWNDKKAEFDDSEPVSENLESEENELSSEGYEADTEPCDACHHVTYEKFPKAANSDEVNIVFPALHLFVCDIFAIQTPVFCQIVAERRKREPSSERIAQLEVTGLPLAEKEEEIGRFLELVVFALNRICALCRRSPTNTELLSREGFMKKALESFRVVLANNYKELKELRTALLDLITLLGVRKLGTEELSLYLECFKVENPPLDELLRPLLQLAVSAPQPTNYLSFPAPRILPGERNVGYPTLLQSTQDTKSGKSLPFSTPGVFKETETSLNMGKQIAVHHVMKGIVSAWESSALQVPLLCDHTWSPRNQGFSAALWFYVKADSYRMDARNADIQHPLVTSQTKATKLDWREASMVFGRNGGYVIDYTSSKPHQVPVITESAKEMDENIGDLHFFSLGTAGCLVEFWLRPERENVVVRVSEATKTSYNVVATDKCQLPFMTRAWHHLAVNCREIVGFRKHSVEIDFFLDGITTNKLLIDLKKALSRRYDRSCLLIGQTSVGVPGNGDEQSDSSSANWFLGNAFIFKTPIFTRENSLYLFALGPDCVDLAECDVDAMKMNILNVVSETAVNAKLNWELLLDGKNSCLQPLQESLLLGYRSDSFVSASIYPTVITPTSDKRPSQQPPIEVPVSLSAELCPLACTHVPSSVRRLGGLSVLLFLLARVVEKSDDEILHASALSLLLKYLRSSSSLQSEFVCIEGRTLLQHLLSTDKFVAGFHALKVFLDLCSEAPMITYNSVQNEFKVAKKHETVLSNYKLLAFTLSLWPLWCGKGQSAAGPQSALALLLKVLQQSVKEENKYCEFNSFMLNKIRVLDLLLSLIKENVLLGCKVDLAPELCDVIMDIIRNVCDMPPAMEALVCIRDFIILAHPSSLTFINQSSPRFFFLLPSCENGNQQSSGLKSLMSRISQQRSGFSKSDRSYSIEPDQGASDAERKDFAQPVDPQKLSKALANLQVKWSADDLQNNQSAHTSVTSSTSQPPLALSLSKAGSEVSCTLRPDIESYSAFNHEVSMEGGEGLERGEEAFLDDWEHVTVRQLEGSSSSGTSQPEIVVTSERKAIPWEVFTRQQSQANFLEEEPGSGKARVVTEMANVVSLVEGLLLFARDSVKVVPDAMVTSVIDHVMKPEILVILCQHPDPGIRLSVLKVLDVIVQRANEEQLLKFVKLNGFVLLGNQLAVYPATADVVEMCLSIILGQQFTFEDVADPVTLFPNEPALYQVAALPLLLSSLRSSVEDTALFHNLIGIVKDMALKVPVVLTALVDFGLIECIITCLHLVSHMTPNETDVVGQREEELLIDDLLRFLSSLAVRLVTVGGISAFQVVQDILHQLNYLEQVDRQHLGLSGIAVYRRAQCRILRETLDTLEGHLGESGSSRRPSPGAEGVLSRENSSRDLRKPLATSYLSVFLNTSLYAHYKQFSRRLSLDKEVTRAEANERVKWLLVRAVDYVVYAEVGDQCYVHGESEKGFLRYLASLLIGSLNVALGKNKSDNWSSLLRSQRDMLRIQFGRIFGFLLSSLQDIDTRLFVVKEIHDSSRCEEIIRLATISSVATEQAINQNLHHLLTHHFPSFDEKARQECLKVYGILQSLGTVHSPTTNGNGWSTVGWGARSLPATPGEGPGEVKNIEDVLSHAKYARAKWLQQLEPTENRARKAMEPLASRVSESAVAITREVVELQNAERRSVLQSIRSKSSKLAQAPALWKSLSDRMIHDKAVWHMPDYFPENWQMDPTEGPDRVRIRLQRCFLDVGDRYLLPEARQKKKGPKSVLEYLVKPAEKYIGNAADRLSLLDVIRYSSPCVLVLPLEENRGEIILGKSNLYFVASSGKVSSWNLDQIRAVYRRRYELQDEAVEVFFADFSTYFFAFGSVVDRDAFLRELSSSNLPSLNSEDGLSELTLLWKDGLITNFAYLMHLNTLAGRSYNDLMQYPVFPFVLADYTSECLDLANPNSFRNLKKPMAVQDPKKEQHYVNNYNYLKNEYQNSSSKELVKVPYHYGSHYSNSGIVLHFMVRLLPYTKLFLSYQDRNFDIPDRTFHNLGATWRLASVESTTDVKEMIPECFFLPEFLVNMNGFDFGLRQCGERVNHVTLPPWASGDPRKFVLLHRQALESDCVREDLNHWIDLVFGYKQHGQAAVEAINVFHPATYAGFDVESIPDPIERNARYTMIKTYGQTPKQLFTTPHPPNAFKSSRDEQTPAYNTATGLKWGNFVGAAGQGDPTLVWKQVHPVRGVLLYPAANGEVFGIAPKCALVVSYPKEKAAPRGSSPVSLQSTAVINWSHPDGLLRVRVKKDVPGRTLVKPPVDDKVVECACAPDSDMMWIGYASGTVEVHQFDFDPQKGEFSVRHRGVILGNHKSRIVSITICKEFSIVVTGSSDRTVMIWDLNRLSYIRSLEPQERDDDTMGAPSLTQTAISPTLGNIVIASKLNQMESSLDLYTINGTFVAHARAPVVTAICYSSAPEGVSVNVVVTGHYCGDIRLWSSWDFAPIRVLSDTVKKPVVCVAYSKECNHLVASFQDGLICVWEKKGSKKYNWAPRVLNLSLI